MSFDGEQRADVLVYGYGGVGVLYAYILERSCKVRVTTVARGNYETVQSHGTDITSGKFGYHKSWKPYRIVSSVEAAADRHYDFIVCCFKCLPDVNPTADMIRPLLVDSSTGKRKTKDNGEESKPVVVLLQNGIGIEKPVHEAYPDLTVISAALWIASNLLDGGRLLEHGDLERLVIGVYVGDSVADVQDHSKWPPEKVQRGKEELDRFCEILLSGGGSPVKAEYLQASRFAKSLWNAAWSSMCSLTRQPLAALITPQALPHVVPSIRAIMEEVVAVARALGLEENVLPERSIDEAIDVTVRRAGTSTPSFKPSLQIDLEGGRPMEIEPLIGAIVERGRLHSVPTPRLETVYATLKVNQDIAVAATHRKTQP